MSEKGAHLFLIKTLQVIIYNTPRRNHELKQNTTDLLKEIENKETEEIITDFKKSPNKYLDILSSYCDLKIIKIQEHIIDCLQVKIYL